MYHYCFAGTRVKTICMIILAAFSIHVLFIPSSSVSAQINAEELVTKGVNAYYKAEFVTAIELLETAVQDKSLRKESAVKAHLYIGGSYYAIGDSEKADNAFKNAVRIDPDLKMHKVVFSPDLIQLVEDIIDTYVAILNVSTVPSAASVEIDNEFIGLSPQGKKIFEGKYAIKVSKNGFKDQERIVSMEGGETKEVRFTLESETAVPVYREQQQVAKKGGSKKWLWILGGTLAAGGVATYLLWPEDETDDGMGTLNITISW